jgi:hypothetical protein
MPAAYDPNASYVLDPEYAAGRKPFDDIQQYLAENPGATINSSTDYWTALGRGAENPTYGMTPDELTNYNYSGTDLSPEARKQREEIHQTIYDRKGGKQELNTPWYHQPGSPGYVTPKTQAELDTFWADPKTDKSLYLMSPEQFAKLTPQQQAQQMESFEYQYDPRYPITNGKIQDNFIDLSTENWLTKLAKGIVIGGATAGLGHALGFTMPSIPGLDSGAGGAATGGVPIPGLESSLFPYTTLPPTGLESSLLPFTTPGAGLGTVPAWGVGGSTIPGLGGPDLGSNLGSGGSSMWQNAKDAYNVYNKGKKGLGIVNQFTGGSLLGGGNQNTGGGTQKQQSSQPDWSRLFSMAAFAAPLPKQEFITDEVSTVKAPEQASEMWQGLTPEQTNIIGMKAGGSVKMVPGPENREYARHAKRGFHVKGIGTGQSDEIPTMLAKDEYVIDSDTVSALGDGSSEAGAAVLDKMREAIRKHKRSAPIDKIPPQAKSPLEYMRRKA